MKTVLSPTCTRSTGLSSLFHWPMCLFLFQYCTVWVTLAFHYNLKVSGMLSHHNGVTVGNGDVLHIFKARGGSGEMISKALARQA